MTITNEQIRARMGNDLYSMASLGDIESMRHRMEREEAAIPRNLKLRLEHAKCRYRDDRMPPNVADVSQPVIGSGKKCSKCNGHKVINYLDEHGRCSQYECDKCVAPPSPL